MPGAPLPEGIRFCVACGKHNFRPLRRLFGQCSARDQIPQVKKIPGSNYLLVAMDAWNALVTWKNIEQSPLTLASPRAIKMSSRTEPDGGILFELVKVITKRVGVVLEH